MRPDPTMERLGFLAVQLAFTSDLGWLAREQPTSDYGVDLHVEEVVDGRPTGRLIAVQVKAGPSYFKERTAEGAVFRDSAHRQYWLGHSLPVIVALYDPVTKIAYWQVVRDDTIVDTVKGMQMIVPWSQRIDEDSEDDLRALFGGDPYVNRLRILRADLPLMHAVEDGSLVMIDVEEWVNKSSGKGTVRVTIDDEPERELTFTAPGWHYDDLLPRMFPWAELVVDEQTYDDHDRDQWDLDTGAWDNEGRRYITRSVDFEDWVGAHVADGLRPYQDDGEVARWRLEARLGRVGEAFLLVDQHLAEL